MNFSERVDKFKKFLEGCKWTFAKTYAEHSPHEYTLRKDSDDKEFQAAVRFIRENGVTEYYKGSKYVVFYVNGFKYWTMGSPINNEDGSPCTILINRARDFEQYSKLAEQYDNLYQDEVSLRENKEVAEMLKDLKGSVLDIGCGTGLLLDIMDIPVAEYLGIDPAKGMLQVFGRKHPWHRTEHTSFELYKGKGFKNVVSLFASVSYIMPNYIENIVKNNPDAKLFLMFYADDYFPKSHKAVAELSAYAYSEEQLEKIFKVKPHRYSNYFIISTL